MSTQENGSAVLYTNRDMRDPELRSLLTGRVAVISVRSPDRPECNEDAAAVIPVGPMKGVLAVADGAGGQPSGAQASQLAIIEIAKAIVPARVEGLKLRNAILNGFEAANQAVQGLGVGAATTLVVAELDDRHLRPYHVGDSMIMAVGQRGRRKLVSISHSPVGYAVEAGVLDEDEALAHEERHLVSNFVGSDDMRIEIGAAIRLAARDTVLLATDGLSDNLRVDEIIDRARKGPLASAVAGLAAACRDRIAGGAGHPNKPDDVTIVAYRPTPQGPPA